MECECTNHMRFQFRHPNLRHRQCSHFQRLQILTRDSNDASDPFAGWSYNSESSMLEVQTNSFQRWLISTTGIRTIDTSRCPLYLFFARVTQTGRSDVALSSRPTPINKLTTRCNSDAASDSGWKCLMAQSRISHESRHEFTAMVLIASVFENYYVYLKPFGLAFVNLLAQLY